MRRCGWCESSLEGRREGAKYCDDRCRAKAWKRANRSIAGQGTGVTVGTVADESRTPSSNGRVPRRSTRDGKGTKLYLLSHELVDLRLGPPYPQQLVKKLQGAEQRIEKRP